MESHKWHLNLYRAVTTKRNILFLILLIMATSLAVNKATLASNRQHWPSTEVFMQDFRVTKNLSGESRFRARSLSPKLEYRYAYRVDGETYPTELWMPEIKNSAVIFFDPDNPADYSFSEPRFPYALSLAVAALGIGWLTRLILDSVRLSRKA